MKKKTAIVYDWIDKWGGVERVLLTLHEMFSEAEFYTSYYDATGASWAYDLKIQTSFIQGMPDFVKKNRLLSLPFYPYAFESFDFSGYDLVISVSSSFAKGIITKPQTRHVAYILTPTRYLWVDPEDYGNKLSHSLANRFIRDLKSWDKIAAQRPDQLISISRTAAGRIKNIYDRDSKIIYPPFDEKYWSKFHRVAPLERDFYLVIGRLEPYKKVELAVEAFATLPDQNLIIIGNGTLYERIKAKASHNVTFIPQASDQELAQYYSFAKALIMPQEEDFGYVSIEAQFFGCPVIAYNKGGATETVLPDKTGIFFDEQSADSLRNAISKFDIISNKFKENMKKYTNTHIKRFARPRFEKEFNDFIQYNNI